MIMHVVSKIELLVCVIVVDRAQSKRVVAMRFWRFGQLSQNLPDSSIPTFEMCAKGVIGNKRKRIEVGVINSATTISTI